MCGAVQLLRVSVHERMSAAAEDFLLQVEKGEEAAEIPALRAKLTERLTAAAEEIVALLEETVAEYEDRVERSEREICRQRRLLDAVLKPQVKLHRAGQSRRGARSTRSKAHMLMLMLAADTNITVFTDVKHFLKFSVFSVNKLMPTTLSAYRIFIYI